MLLAGTHPRGHKLKETKRRCRGPRALSSQFPPPGRPRLATPSCSAHSAPGSPGASSPAPCPGRLNVLSPDHCFGPHSGEGASLGLALDQALAPSGAPFSRRLPSLRPSWDGLRGEQTFEWIKIKRSPSGAGEPGSGGVRASLPLSVSLRLSLEYKSLKK